MAAYIKTGSTVFDLDRVVGYQMAWAFGAGQTITSLQVYMDTGAEIAIGRTNQETENDHVARLNALMAELDGRLTPSPLPNSPQPSP